MKIWLKNNGKRSQKRGQELSLNLIKQPQVEKLALSQACKTCSIQQCQTPWRPVQKFHEYQMTGAIKVLKGISVEWQMNQTFSITLHSHTIGDRIVYRLYTHSFIHI